MRSLRLVVPELGAASFWRLEAGVPFTIGTNGDWAVGGGRLRAIHALAYFDGRALLVASASDDAQVRVGGRTVGTSWTAIEQPARIELGPIAIEYDAAQAKGGTVRMILPQLAAAPVSAFQQGAIATVKKRKGPWSKLLFSGLGQRGPIILSGAIVAVALVIAAILCVSPARAARRQTIAPKAPAARALPPATASAAASSPVAAPRPTRSMPAIARRARRSMPSSRPLAPTTPRSPRSVESWGSRSEASAASSSLTREGRAS